ncbi:MAG: VCBS repeat-containing protein [Flavobacteriales bacterium]|nr:VCBS repeat-containing protein [Flavobacteriales bacterium]
MRLLFPVLIIYLISCTPSKKKQGSVEPEPSSSLFKALSVEESGIRFSNDLRETKEFNYLRYIYTYNGGGVAIGDVNGDGLEDILFSGNQVPNSLYLNQGDLKFVDVTESSGLIDGTSWCTGVNMIDIDADGDLDLYICRSASLSDESLRRNLLYINDGKGTFKEQGAQFGLADAGFSTQAYFFDYDQDGDLDCYVLNHLTKVKTDQVVHWSQDASFDPALSDRLYRNEGGQFTDVTEASGILNQCWGLSACIDDFDQDGWPDIYVCNDFREGDILYINQKDGTFRDDLNTHFSHTSFYSMGSDAADLDNDGLYELMVLDMAPKSHERSKQNMAAMQRDAFWKMTEIGYHHQYMHNMLHWNIGNGRYSEISQYAGMANTDWSWSALMADLDLDGLKDIYVTNGIKKDVNDRDYKLLIENRFRSGQPMGFQEVMQNWPSQRVANIAYRNRGAMQFEEARDSWGLNEAVTSHGAAYADLDNDGDLDIVVNHMDRPATVYENHSQAKGVTIDLRGEGLNPFAIGARLTYQDSVGLQILTKQPTRGFQSSVGNGLTVALRSTNGKIAVTWPDGTQTSYSGPFSPGRITLSKASGSEEDPPTLVIKNFSVYDMASIHTHKENPYDDYQREVLIPQKMSGLGPCLATGDLNGDGVDDLFIGASKGQAAGTFLLSQNGNLTQINEGLWKNEVEYEDGAGHFLDVDADGDLDLMVTCGGNEEDSSIEDYPIRFYLNNGQGEFSKTSSPLGYLNSNSITSSDYDQDGDVDVFLGGRQVAGRYGINAHSLLLKNESGTLNVDANTETLFADLGMVTDVRFVDVNGDGWDDLLITGEWMPILLSINEQGSLQAPRPIYPSTGWWYALETVDIDRDGDLDIVAGNLGQNNKFHPSSEKPLELYVGDLNKDGSHDIVLAKSTSGRTIPVRGRDCSMDQIPELGMKFPSYTSFSQADLNTIYGYPNLSKAHHSSLDEFASCMFINKGNGEFEKVLLPWQAQLGPILDIELADIDSDGLDDLIIAGGIYDVENETTRYDGQVGMVLFNRGETRFEVDEHYLGFLPYPVKALSWSSTTATPFLLSVENNGPLRRTEFE